MSSLNLFTPGQIPPGGHYPGVIPRGLSSTFWYAMGTTALLQGYQGPLFEAKRVSDGATQMFNAGSDGHVNLNDLVAFSGGGDVKVNRFVDQVTATDMTTAANTAYIVESGTPVIRLGKLAARFKPNSGIYTLTRNTPTPPHDIITLFLGVCDVAPPDTQYRPFYQEVGSTTLGLKFGFSTNPSFDRGIMYYSPSSGSQNSFQVMHDRFNAANVPKLMGYVMISENTYQPRVHPPLIGGSFQSIPAPAVNDGIINTTNFSFRIGQIADIHSPTSWSNHEVTIFGSAALRDIWPTYGISLTVTSAAYVLGNEIKGYMQ